MSFLVTQLHIFFLCDLATLSGRKTINTSIRIPFYFATVRVNWLSFLFDIFYFTNAIVCIITSQ